MRRLLRPEASAGEEPNLAPLIDIVFILLIFFVVTTTFAKDLGLEIERPSAVSGAELPSRVVRVAVARSGELTVDGRPTSPWRLEAEVKHRLAHDTEKAVLVVADRELGTGDLVEVMDACRLAGAASLAVATESLP